MIKVTKKSTRDVYLDYAATTPLDPIVLKAMQPFWSDKFGNPSSVYKQGREAKQVIEQSRKTISKILNCRAEEIIFTAGGTESINIAILGSARNQLKKLGQVHVITSAIEHNAVLNCVRRLEKEGARATYVKPDSRGIIDPDSIISSITPETVLISIMYANNEVGSIQPIQKLTEQLKRINRKREQNKQPAILLHSDACQAAGSLNLNIQELGIDMLSINASKIYGPKQIGCLYIKSGTSLEPVIFGGGQENNFRSGTENVPAIAGFAKALELSQKGRKKENLRLKKLRNYFITKILKTIKGVELNGPGFENDSESDPIRLPNNINFSFLGVEGEALMLYLDSYGISVSTGSACDSAQSDPSHVIQALGKSADQAASSIRFTLGKKTTKNDLDYTAKVLTRLVEQLRNVSRS